MSRFKLTLQWPSKGTISRVMKASAKEAFYESKIEDLFADAAVVPAFDARRLATDPHKDQWPVVELPLDFILLASTGSNGILRNNGCQRKLLSFTGISYVWQSGCAAAAVHLILT